MEAFLESPIFRCLINSLTIVGNTRQITANEILFEKMYHPKRPDLCEPWKGGTIYCQWKLQPAMQDFLDNLYILFSYLGVSIPITIPALLLCSEEPPASNVFFFLSIVSCFFEIMCYKHNSNN